MKFKLHVKEIVKQTTDIISIRFQRPREFDYIPGQYMLVILESEGKKIQKYFTISSSPTEQDFIELTKRLTGHEFSNALESLKIGDEVLIDAPFGNFTFTGEYNKIAMLSGGVGITPLRSIIRYCTDKKLTTDIILIYSNNLENNIAYIDEFQKIEKEENPNFKVIHVITRPTEEWTGLTGYISKEIIQKTISDFKERVFYISGPDIMVKTMISILKEMNVPEKQIIYESFYGY